jgi:penicillin amidase
VRIFLRIVTGLLLVVVLALAGAFFWLRHSLPTLEGEVVARGVSAPVEIVRDKEGVPHIRAATERDGWYAMGYVHAQDRLWQLEFQRRVAAGRLAEFLGERAYDNDRLMRTLGIRDLSIRIAGKLDAKTRESLQAYADGVNAVMAGSKLPPEFTVFRIEPEPWKPEDTIGWLFVMAWDLSGNWRSELARARFAAQLGTMRANEIMPPYPGDAAIALPDYTELYKKIEPIAGQLMAAFPGAEEAVGSNNWVLDGSHTESGKPLLANDPHLGLQAPSLWYLAHVATPEGNVLGGTLPGVPFVVLGRNDRVAWTMTTTGGDTQDLFVERLVPNDATRYLLPGGGTAPFTIREEVIRVGSEDRRIRIRSTRHGPVISDVVRNVAGVTPKGHVIALAWAALSEENATARGGFALNRARNAAGIVEAARDFHSPQQTIVYADVEGTIGMIAPALVPRRRADNEAMGRVPVPGWIARYDWDGFVPYEQMPAIVSPRTGMIVTANHRITPPGYREFMTTDWFPPYRAERVEKLLGEREKHSMVSMRALQADDLSRLAVEALPMMTAAAPATEGGKRAKAKVAGWKGNMAVNEAAPLVFSAWYREFTRLVYADELGLLFPEGWELRSSFMIGAMRGERPYVGWCDNVATKDAETCEDLASQAFDLAAVDLQKRYGEDSRWRYGQAHFAAGSHRPLGFTPVLGRFFNVEPESAGDATSVNVGATTIRDEAFPFSNRHAPSLRAIYDFSDLERSVFIHSTGQSGHVASRWYSSFAERWARVDYITIPTKPDASQSAYVLRLVP